ncbi:MAG TPA: UDP-3-O-(3-hydroxymyristoyl)glucosamine N-acyltransferase, partial [Armatimonadetes bacterium]|nr:UDP-3-O-(3-hydroxymyristoyl)glucosamine N-acyltransferase [Armatimonadota bacterium]
MAFTLSQIASALNTTPLGDADIVIEALAEPGDAGSTDLALAMDPKYAEALNKSQARAAVIWQDADWQSLGLQGAIVIPRASAALPALTQMMAADLLIKPGIHASCVIDPSAQIGAGAAIAPFVVIGPNVKIGNNARIFSHVSISENTRIGENCL